MKTAIGGKKPKTRLRESAQWNALQREMLTPAGDRLANQTAARMPLVEFMEYQGLLLLGSFRATASTWLPVSAAVGRRVYAPWAARVYTPTKMPTWAFVCF